jgi:membrane-associated tyrosine/threonine-specific cdc2-inhibitory kinase
MAKTEFQSPLASHLNGVTVTPRPTPQFLSEATFSHRKRTPFRAPKPPRPPTKSCPPVSRIFETPNHTNVARAVSFKLPKSEQLVSPFYSSDSKELYFEQCFIIKEKLGEGSFGEVYKVQSKEDHDFYAVKRSAEKFKGALDRKKKLTEVEKHEKLPLHPNLVKFVRAWEERSRLYIQIELCLMTLAEYADVHGRLDDQLGMKFLIDLTKGVKHLHDHNLCHFDIKPPNSFISLDGATCKLGDFGLVVSLDDAEMLSLAQEGDPKYMAPELMRGEFGKPADIFSLGISMLEVSCDLELPGYGPQWHQLREERLPEEFTQYLSPSLKTIISSMLTSRPQHRPSAQDLLESQIVANFERKQLNGSGLLPIRHLNSSSCQSCTTVSPASLFVSDDDESFHQVPVESSCSDDSSSSIHQNKSWLNDGPLVAPSPVYLGPPIPLNYEESDGDEMDDTPSPAIHVTLQSFVNSPFTKTSSPVYSRENSFNKTPIDKNDVKKSQFAAPKNLFDAFSDAEGEFS